MSRVPLPVTGGRELINLLRACDPLVNRLSPGESFLRAVPMRDGLLSQLPAQENDLAFDFAGKIEQANVNVFHLHPDGVDLGQRIFGALFRLDALRLAPSQRDHIEKRPTIQKKSMAESLLLGLNLFDNFLARDRSPQQRLEHRQQRLRFFKAKSPV